MVSEHGISRITTNDDKIYCSKRVLIDLCSNMSMEVIPPELRSLLSELDRGVEVPPEGPTDMASDSDTRGTGKPEASQKSGMHRPVARKATPRICTEPIIPDLTVLFGENQHGDMRDAHHHVTTTRRKSSLAAADKDSVKGHDT